MILRMSDDSYDWLSPIYEERLLFEGRRTFYIAFLQLNLIKRGTTQHSNPTILMRSNP